MKVVANFKNGTRAYLRSGIRRYEDGTMLAAGQLVFCRRASLALDLAADEAEDFINDGHNKPAWMKAQNIFLLEAAQ